MNRTIARLTLPLVLLALAACQDHIGFVSTAPTASISPPNCLAPPTVTSQVPGDSPLQDQPNFNCLAWQSFIGLNWLADPKHNGAPKPGAGADTFGQPGDLSPVVWQTYKDYHEVFQPQAAKPAAWNTPKPVPQACQALADQPAFAAVFLDSDDTRQAAPAHGPNWLASASGQLVWYEMLMSEDEFNYVVGNGYFAAEQQLAAVEAGKHIDLPRGGFGGPLGSIELKAAWLAIESPEDYNTYKVTQGFIYNSVADTCETSYLALVGLHILHKTQTQPQWVWATFEHIGNAPDAGQSPSDNYVFYSPDCRSHAIAEACNPDTPTTSCTANTPPAYEPVSEICPAYGIQVDRIQPIPDTSVNPVRSLNAYVQQQIKDANADSVWQHYQLVNVLWSSSPVDPNQPGTPPPVIPLTISGMTPDPTAQPVANTTMETYAQDKTCVKCHRYATIANSSTYASDFSFLLGRAQPAEGNGLKETE